MADDDIRSQVEARLREEAGRLESEEAGRLESKDNSNEIPLRFISECLWANEVGDGMLFAIINRDSFIFEPSSGVWFFWNGVVFERDIEGRAAGAMEGVAGEYLRYLSSLTKKTEDK